MDYKDRSSLKKEVSKKQLIIGVAVIVAIGAILFVVSRAQTANKAGVQNKNSSVKSNDKVFLACDLLDTAAAEKVIKASLEESASTLSSVKAGTTLTTGCTYVSKDPKVNEAVTATIQVVRTADENTAKTNYESLKKQADTVRETAAENKKTDDKKDEATSEEVKDIGDQGIFIVRNGQLAAQKGRYVVKVSVKKGREYNKDLAKETAKVLISKLP